MKIMIKNNYTTGLLAKLVEDKCVEALEKYQKDTLSDVTRKAPVRTGKLANSFKGVLDKRKLESQIGTDVKYAPYVEFGTIEMYDGSYANSLGVSGYAYQFKQSSRTSGGVSARRFFFSTIRQNFLLMFDDLKRSLNERK
jgi:hypothetical protein